MKPLIKICGINDFNVLQQLVSIDNINYLGFIFYEKSVRNVSPKFLEQVKEFEFKDKRPVCVYVNSDQDFIKETSSYFKDPILQFHGDETSDFCNSFDNEFWKVLRINNQINVDEIIRYEKASGILFENYKKDVQNKIRTNQIRFVGSSPRSTTRNPRSKRRSLMNRAS